ncbi:MAG: hypothetical protein IJG13_00360 [Kiritimatiellae bacterium]|nr:hypothetical protein [Kiritimatiellia bacterium]
MAPDFLAAPAVAAALRTPRVRGLRILAARELPVRGALAAKVSTVIQVMSILTGLLRRLAVVAARERPAGMAMRIQGRRAMAAMEYSATSVARQSTTAVAVAAVRRHTHTRTRSSIWPLADLAVAVAAAQRSRLIRALPPARTA